MKQYLDSATFWLNKIRRDAHDHMDKKPQDWCTALITMLKELITLITEQFPEGFKWNAKGVSVNDVPSALPALPALSALPAAATPVQPVQPVEATQATQVAQGKVDLQNEVGEMV